MSHVAASNISFSEYFRPESTSLATLHAHSCIAKSFVFPEVHQALAGLKLPPADAMINLAGTRSTTSTVQAVC